MRHRAGIALIVGLGLLGLACSSNTENPIPSDTGKVDAKGSDYLVGGEGTVGDSAGSNNHDFVIKSFVLPKDNTEATSYGYDYTGSGKKNALGAVIVAISAAAGGVDMQKDMNQNLLNGNVIVLEQVVAKSLQSDTSTTLQGWTGQKVACCTTKPCSDSDSSKTCFSGSYSFQKDSSSPSGSSLSGKIDAGKLQLGPGSFQVMLPIGYYPAQVTLKAARVEGTITSAGITAGKITGAISQDDLTKKVLPSVAQVLDGEMNDSTTAPSTAKAISDMFDTNKDKKISADELAQNALIKAALAGDVDVDNDGKNEFSAGIGFTAVSCAIK
jgi:hypothetical protein